MALVIVNAGTAPPPALWQALCALPPDAPIIVMIHGYRFCPSSVPHDPHRHILSLTPDAEARRALSWPAALGLTPDGAEGLGIAFGWSARGALPKVYARAADAGAELAALIDQIAEISQRPVQIIGHSLGARVALQTLHHARAGSVGRMILLAAAELRDQADAAMDSRAGARAEVINITSRENDPFDFLLELVVGRARRQALGFGLTRPRQNWLDVQIDDPGVIEALHSLGFRVSGLAQRACHWSPYLRDGIFDLYRTALAQPWALPLTLLRHHIPARPAPRWSRLLGRPSLPINPLSAARSG